MAEANNSIRGQTYLTSAERLLRQYSMEKDERSLSLAMENLERASLIGANVDGLLVRLVNTYRTLP